MKIAHYRIESAVEKYVKQYIFKEELESLNKKISDIVDSIYIENITEHREALNKTPQEFLKKSNIISLIISYNKEYDYNSISQFKMSFTDYVPITNDEKFFKTTEIQRNKLKLLSKQKTDLNQSCYELKHKLVAILKRYSIDTDKKIEKYIPELKQFINFPTNNVLKINKKESSVNCDSLSESIKELINKYKESIKHAV